MTNKKWLLRLVVVLGFAFFAWYVLRNWIKPFWVSVQPPPNIVLIIVDSLRADLLGCYGQPESTTSPEIDNLAADGLIFEKVISQCSWTRPSIASMITSQYPRSLGIYREKFDILADRHITLAEALKARGYRTFGITANPNLNKTFNFHQGFDEYVESSVIFGWMEPEKDKKFLWEDHEAELPRSLQIFNWAYQQVQASVEHPTFLQIVIMEVHSPHLVRSSFKDLYANLPVRDKHDYYPEKEVSQRVRGTYAAVRQVSNDISDFVKKVVSLPGWENTLFIITSDHGQGLDDHPSVKGSLYHGNILYESQVRVPLIFYNPVDPDRIHRGKKVKEPIRLLDLMPTILDYIGKPVTEPASGKSVLPMAIVDGSPHSLPEVFITETNWRNVEKIAAYGNSWKYIDNRDGWKGVNRYELQRLGSKEDGLLTDEIATHRQEAEELRLALSQWEIKFAKEKSTQPNESLTEEELQQLKSLGYLQ